MSERPGGTRCVKTRELVRGSGRGGGVGGGKFQKVVLLPTIF